METATPKAPPNPFRVRRMRRKPARHPAAKRHAGVTGGKVDEASYCYIPKVQLPGTHIREPWLR